MKCCDSITSAMARSNSALIARYCALRSNSGTFIDSTTLQFLIGFGAFVQFRRKGRFLVQVHALQDARTGFLVTETAFRAMHHSVAVRSLQTVPVPAHPTRL